MIQIFRNLNVFTKTLIIWDFNKILFFNGFGSFAVTFLFISLKCPTGYMSLTSVCFCCFLQSWKAYCSDELLCRFSSCDQRCVLDMFCAATRLQRPVPACRSQGRCGVNLNTQSHLKNTKVQLMQTNNWLANEYHFCLCFFFFNSIPSPPYPHPLHISRFKRKYKLYDRSFEVATTQICPKRYKNIQSVRVAEMLRLVSSLR